MEKTNYKLYFSSREWLIKVLGEEKTIEIEEKMKGYRSNSRLDLPPLNIQDNIAEIVRWDEHEETSYWENLDKEYKQKLADYLKQNK